MLDKIKNSKADDKPGRNGKSVEPMERLYRPSDKEPFMNERQREYFRLKLLDWREDILKEAKETLQHLQDESPKSSRLRRPRLLGDRPGHRTARP